MSIPDGSRQSTSPRSDSAIRSVGRSRMEGASTGTLSSARRSPNWMLPSIRTVRWSIWASATARLNAMVVLPTPPFGEKMVMTRVVPTVWRASKSFLTCAIRVIRSKPENGIDRTPSIPRAGSGSIGFCGTVRTITGTSRPASRICSTSFGPLTRPWSRASTITTSGRISPIAAIARAPSVSTSSSLTRAWVSRRPRMY